MKWFHLSIDASRPGLIWSGLTWSLQSARSRCVDLLPLVHPGRRDESIGHRLRGWRARRLASKIACDAVRASLSPGGPNVLEVEVVGCSDLALTSLLDPVWDCFSHRIATVIDTVEPNNFRPSFLQRFDRVYSPCGELAAQYAAHSGVRCSQLQHCSPVLDFYSCGAFRPIDMIVVGRRRWSFHTPIHKYYNSPGSNRLFLDFVTRTQKALLPEAEWRLLMSTYAKSKIAFCFEPSDIPRFKNRSALTARWLQAWAAGCTVVGTRPTGPGVAELIDWPESTIEIPANPAEWIPFLEEILNDAEGLERRRNRNVVEALRRCDTRIRFADLLADLGLSPTEAHRRELARLAETIATLEQRFGISPLGSDARAKA